MRGIATTLALIVVSVLLTGCERYKLDRQMEELCKKDGGVQVYETVTLPPEMFDRNGYPFPEQLRGNRKSTTGTEFVEDQVKLGADYRLISRITYLKNGDPVKGEGVLMRFSEKVVRESDSKVLGEAMSFGRSGGDFIAFAHPSSNHCPAGQGTNAATRAVFIKRGD